MSEIWESLKQRDGAKLPAEPGEQSASGRDERAEKSRCFSQFGVAPEAACPASLLYHLHSRLSPEWECPLSDAEVSQLTLDLTAYKRYPAARNIALPRAFAARAPLEAVIRQRRTAHSFRRTTMSLEGLATLLQLSCGVTRDGRLPLRAAPSPGGLYAVESYPVAFDVASVAPGVYHYVPIEHTIECVRGLGGVEDMWPALPPGWHGETPALAVVLIAQLRRVQAKYGERGYRFLLQESGHIAQNASLVATALGLTAVGIGGFLDDVMNSLIGVDGEQEVALYVILIGAEKAQVFNSDNQKENDMSTVGPNLDAIVGRAVRDTEFRKRLLTDAKSIAKEYNLSADELTTLQNLNKDAADEFFGKVVGGKMIMGCTSKTCYERG